MRGGRLGVVQLQPRIEVVLENILSETRGLLREVSQRRFSGKQKEQANKLLGRFDQELANLAATKVLVGQKLSQEKQVRSAEMDETHARAQEALLNSVTEARERSTVLPAPMQPWNSYTWNDWQPGIECNLLFGGYLVPNNDPELGQHGSFGAETYLPLYFPTGGGIRLAYGSRSRDRTIGLSRSILTRLLTALQPGKIRLSIFDPVGLGQSVSNLLELAEFDPELIGGKVWSSGPDLLNLFREQTAYIELVIQKYLRGNYETIAEFNREAGEIAEPLRCLVVYDFPTGFNEETFNELVRIMRNGPRCGLSTMLLTNRETALPTGLDPAALPTDPFTVNMDAPFSSESGNYRLSLSFWPDSDSEIPRDVMGRIVQTVGRTAKNDEDKPVSFDRSMKLLVEASTRGVRSGLPQLRHPVDVTDELTWWSCKTTEGISAPLGQSGARDVAVLTFDSGDHAGALLVGRPGSGKSTLLHTLIAGVTTLYSPEELELYLVDFKEGVEFKGYATENLPHARCVAVETDREFGLSVLQALDSEIKRRAELLRNTGGEHSGLESLRVDTGEQLARILLIFDEFHELFSKNDKIGIAAADLLEGLIRQGRGFGIHVILGSQSLAGMDALGTHVPQLLPVRILLPAAEADARRVLGEENDAGNYLSHRGEAVLNRAGGQVEANERFRVAFLEESERSGRIRKLRELADDRGWTRRPVVFEGSSAAALDAMDPRVFFEELAASPGSPQLRLRTARPMSITGVADIRLRREAGSNVVFIGRESGTASDDSLGMADESGLATDFLVTAVASAACAGAQIDVVDFTSQDEGFASALRPLLDSDRLHLWRRRQVGDVIDGTLQELRDRLEADDTTDRTSKILFLHGMHRARDFDTESLDFDESGISLPDKLLEILRDGPEVGIHTVIWAETIAGLARRLPAQGIRECGWRVAAKLSSDDSRAFIDSDAAASLRDHQVVVTNDDLGFSRRCTAYGQPNTEWLNNVLQNLEH